MELAELKTKVEEIKWFHGIDLGNGIVTPGVDCSKEKLKKIKIPDNLQGMSVLDIGAWDGFFSFEAERRGAKRILAVDSVSWEGSTWGRKDGFELARNVLNSKVEDINLEVLDISPERVGIFDLVLFLGVLYHLRHPLLALERVSSVTKNQLILETHIDLLQIKRPAMMFYAGSEIYNDPTNWWGPNPAAVVSMLKDVGFRKVKIVSLYTPIMQYLLPANILFRTIKAVGLQLVRKEPFSRNLHTARIVVHAWK